MELNSLPDNLGAFLIDQVRAIDKQCCKIIDGIECGLVYIRDQFGEAALRETGKKHTEELLISWRLAAALRAAGVEINLEECYPNTREHCDLVVHIPDGPAFALEVKIAWKKWVWTDQSVHTSSAFKGYLLGDATHNGTAHDYVKLQRAIWSQPTWLGVLLVGFDSFAAPMDDMIAQLERQQDLHRNGWELSAHDSWADRRNTQYRIACWFWRHPPMLTEAP